MQFIILQFDLVKMLKLFPESPRQNSFLLGTFEVLLKLINACHYFPRFLLLAWKLIG